MIFNGTMTVRITLPEPGPGLDLLDEDSELRLQHWTELMKHSRIEILAVTEVSLVQEESP